MTCPICGESPCHFDVPLDSPEIWALKQKNYRFLLRSVERALEGKPFVTEEEERKGENYDGRR